MKRLIALLGVAIILSSCATAYKKIGFTGGYSETQLGENIFQVSFRGNGYTSRERALDFSLLRSAEIALENGYRYFIIIEAEKSSSLSTYTTPKTSHTTGNIYVSGNYATGNATTYSYGGQTYFISKPRAINTILCFNEKPEVNLLVFDAEFVKKSIRQKYGLNKK
jgi:uncharacterized protein YceK